MGAFSVGKIKIKGPSLTIQQEEDGDHKEGTRMNEETNKHLLSISK